MRKSALRELAPKVIQQIRKCRRFRLVRRPKSRPREYSWFDRWL